MRARVWSAAMGMCVGALSGGGMALAAVLGAAALPALLVRRRPWVTVAGVALAAAGAGSAVAPVPDAGPLALWARRVPLCDLDGRVLEQLGGLGTLVSVRLLTCDRVTVRDAGAIVMELPRAGAGARVSAEGWLVPLGDDRFDAARRRSGAEAAFAPTSVRVGAVESAVQRVAAAFRSGLRRATGGLDGDRAALVRGLTIGDIGDAAHSDAMALRRAGLAHLVAVSGSNVALVVGAVVVAARDLRPRVRIAIAGAVLALFVVIVGPEPSVLRAAVMGAIGLLALSHGARVDPLAALGLAIVVVIGVRPAMVHSVGLHLSVAATGGIVLWAPSVARKIVRVPRPVALGLAATLCAQVAVAPVTVGAFGELSVVGPVANALALPVVPAATIAGMVGGLVETLGLPGGGIAASVAGWCAGWILAVGRALGGWEPAAIRLPSAAGLLLAVPVAVAVAAALRTGGARPIGSR